MPAARSLRCPARYSAAWAVEFARSVTATGSGPQALAPVPLPRRALLAVLFLAAEPARPIQLARPAGPAADEAGTAEGAHEAETRPHPAAAAR
jgi:hypothetical protein